MFMLGKKNTVTDREAGTCYLDGEWLLFPKYLQLAFQLLKFSPNIYLFAIKTNNLIIM